VGQSGHSKKWGILNFSTGKEMIITNWEQKFLHPRIVSAVKTVGFVSDRMSYIALRVRWRNIIHANVHAPTEKNVRSQKIVFMRN